MLDDYEAFFGRGRNEVFRDFIEERFVYVSPVQPFGLGLVSCFQPGFADVLGHVEEVEHVICMRGLEKGADPGAVLRAVAGEVRGQRSFRSAGARHVRSEDLAEAVPVFDVVREGMDGAVADLGEPLVFSDEDCGNSRRDLAGQGGFAGSGFAADEVQHGGFWHGLVTL